jgi:hypothetical protein
MSFCRINISNRSRKKIDTELHQHFNSKGEPSGARVRKPTTVIKTLGLERVS